MESEAEDASTEMLATRKPVSELFRRDSAFKEVSFHVTKYFVAILFVIRNFKTFHIRSPSLDCTDPIPLQDFSSPSSSSTPLVLDYRTSRASVSYQLDLSGSRTPDGAWNGRQRRLDTGLEDRQ